MAIRIVRLGSPRARGEGLRLGTVRRPPRGVSKSEYATRDFYDVWLPDLAPSEGAGPTQYESALEPHALGSVLVSAVFEAFVTIVRRKGERLLRIAGLDPREVGQADLGDALVKAISQEASDVAGHVDARSQSLGLLVPRSRVPELTGDVAQERAARQRAARLGNRALHHIPDVPEVASALLLALVDLAVSGES